MKNNPELEKIANQDQVDRSKYDTGDLSEVELWAKDRVRLSRVVEILNAGEMKTSSDYINAAIVFQHGRDKGNKRDPFASGMAVKMMREAITLDASVDKWLLAAAIDRDLMIRDEPQIYGTQYIRKGEGHPWEFYKLDSSVISDEERRAHRVETLAEQKIELERINKKKLIERFPTGENINEILDFCKTYFSKESEYDVSWKGMSRFAFQLKRLKKTEAAFFVFKLITELYPNEYDPFHSLGNLLAEMGRKEEAIEAIKKSIELNPEFELGKKDLSDLMEK